LTLSAADARSASCAFSHAAAVAPLLAAAAASAAAAPRWREALRPEDGDATGSVVGGDAALGELLWALALPMASASSMARSLLAMLLVAPMLLARALPDAGRAGRVGRAGPADCDLRRPAAGRPAERCVDPFAAALDKSHTPTQHLAGCEARRSLRASAGALSKSVDAAVFAACLRYASSAVGATVSGRLCRTVRLSDAGAPFGRLQTPPCSSPRVDASERVE